MSMRWLFALVLCWLAGTAYSAEPDPKIGLALELLDVMHMDALMKNTQDQLHGMFQGQFASIAGCAAAKPIVDEFSEKLSEQVLGTLGSEDFKVDVAAAYAEVFSPSELQEMIDFYRTPLGQKMLVHMPELMQKSMLITQARMKTLQPQLVALAGSYDQRIREASASCGVGTEARAGK